jgi:chromate transporter
MMKIRELARPFLKIGAFGFGGGVGMLAMLRSECVKKKKWLTDEELSVGVAIGQMVPGPFIPNYCQYIGYHLDGYKGAITATVALLLPSFFLMVVLSYLYLAFHTLPGIGQVFKGIGAVMTAIILWASYDMGKILIKELKGLIVFGLALVLFIIKFDPVLTVLACGGIKIILDQCPSKKILMAVPLFIFDLKKALMLFWIFFKTGAIIFGGGYAAIPFIKNEVCNNQQWLTLREFFDGVALGQMTPGPVAITATFVGFKVMGLAGALIATIAIFLPSFLMFIIVIRIYKKIENNRYVKSFFSGLKSAIVAILLSTGIFFVFQNWINVPYGVFGLVCLITLVFTRVEPIFFVIAGVVFGLIVR